MNTSPAPPPANLSEYDRLTRPLPLLSPKRLYFGAARLLLTTAGRLSYGVQLGWRTGFDSGETLDYVYANKPQGITFLGRWLDRIYLNSIGWRGIRLRKINLENTLLQAIETLRGEGKAIRLLDIAAGPGRYILDTLQKVSDTGLTALLRDREPRNLDAGRRLAQERGLRNVTYEAGDAFDRDSLANIQPRPTLAIVSGLYELFPDNQLIARSLAGLSEALRDGGFLIYTNQPHHPQLEMIARVLVNRDGQPWVMRCRPQAEMDSLVADAGFEKLSTVSDPWGIFTVSLARRRTGVGTASAERSA